VTATKSPATGAISLFDRRAAVCGPPSVTDAVNATQRRDLDRVFQVDRLAGRAADIQLAVFVHDGAAGGIIATIFEAR